MLPDLATLYVAGGGAGAGGLAFWSDVYGFEMSPISSALQVHAADWLVCQLCLHSRRLVEVCIMMNRLHCKHSCTARIECASIIAAACRRRRCGTRWWRWCRQSSW